jgi:hypothetical protein
MMRRNSQWYDEDTNTFAVGGEDLSDPAEMANLA